MLRRNRRRSFIFGPCSAGRNCDGQGPRKRHGFRDQAASSDEVHRKLSSFPGCSKLQRLQSCSVCQVGMLDHQLGVSFEEFHPEPLQPTPRWAAGDEKGSKKTARSSYSVLWDLCSCPCFALECPYVEVFQNWSQFTKQSKMQKRNREAISQRLSMSAGSTTTTGAFDCLLQLCILYQSSPALMIVRVCRL